MLAKVLPPKREYVLNIRLSGVQDALYQRFLSYKSQSAMYQATDLFSTFSMLAKVSAHTL